MFAHAPRDADVPDVELAESELSDLDDHYFRHLGVRGSLDFYMARTDHDGTTAQGLCFIAVNDELEAAETNCLAPDDLDNMVVALDPTSLGAPGDAFLIPDDTQLQLPAGWAQIRRNIVLVTDPQQAPQEVEGQLSGTADWENFTLQQSSPE